VSEVAAFLGVALLVASEPAFLALSWRARVPRVARRPGFTSLLPQFGTTEAGPSFWLMLGFGLLFCLLTWLWLALYAATLDRLGRALSGRPWRAIEAASGAVLVALGLRLAAEPRPR
jgi:hypothetical protein